MFKNLFQRTSWNFVQHHMWPTRILTTRCISSLCRSVFPCGVILNLISGTNSGRFAQRVIHSKWAICDEMKSLQCHEILRYISSRLSRNLISETHSEGSYSIPICPRKKQQPRFERSSKDSWQPLVRVPESDFRNSEYVGKLTNALPVGRVKLILYAYIGMYRCSYTWI